MSNYGNRGMWLEHVIERCNRLYKNKGQAVIDKVPTNISYNTRTQKARFKAKGTVDFIGTLKGGQSVAFDTKNTTTNALKFDNVRPHQEQYLLSVDELGGKAFLLIYFQKHEEMYTIDIKDYANYKLTAERKSIPYSYFADKEPVQSVNGIPFDYLRMEGTN